MTEPAPSRSPSPIQIDPVGEATLEILDASPQYAALIWERIESLGSIRGKVLEVGCGIGTMSHLILRSPFVEALDSLDMNPSYVDRVRREIRDPRFRAFSARAEDYLPGEGIYDRAVSVNVLEHIADDRKALGNIARILRPGGECAVLVPAHPALFSPLDEGLSHFRRYSRSRLETLARESGLEPLRMVHFNPLGALGWWVNGKVLRRRCLPARQVAAYSRLLIRLSRLLDRLNPLPLGISLIARLGKR